MNFATDLAEQMCAATPARIGAPTLATATLTVASSLAAAAVGVRTAPVRIVRDLVRHRLSTPESTVWFTGGQSATSVDATRVNHMAADESMADDSALLNGSHLGSAVTAAALAVAETTGAAGADVLAAIVAGYEAAIRVGRAEARLRPARNAHVSGLNAFGCAVAAAKLLGSDPETTAHAIMLAATGTSGVDRVSTNSARSYQAGFSAAVGVEAAYAAHHGYRTAASVLDRYLDLIEFNGLPTGKSASAAMAADGKWAIDTELILKLRPGAFLFGSAVEAALRLGLRAEDITNLTVRGHRFVDEPPGNRPLPAGSLAWYVASAIVRSRFDWTHFDDGHDDAEAIEALRERVTIEPTSAANAPGAWGWAAEVIATTTAGETVRAAVDLPPGAVVAHVDWHQIEAKAYHLMGGAGIGADAIAGILEMVRTLREAPDTADLVRLIG